jgi:hypothetical protein
MLSFPDLMTKGFIKLNDNIGLDKNICLDSLTYFDGVSEISNKSFMMMRLTTVFEITTLKFSQFCLKI